jgi:hypothetical protein
MSTLAKMKATVKRSVTGGLYLDYPTMTRSVSIDYASTIRSQSYVKRDCKLIVESNFTVKTFTPTNLPALLCVRHNRIITWQNIGKRLLKSIAGMKSRQPVFVRLF